MKVKKTVSIVFLAIVLANFLLFIFNQSNPLTFWIITALAALVAYVLLPRLKD